MNKKHKHAEVIKAYADGEAIQICVDGVWMDFQEGHPISTQCEYRIKPTAPKWPKTTMDDPTLVSNYSKAFGMAEVDRLRVIANAALAHALETGQVVLPSKEDEWTSIQGDDQVWRPGRVVNGRIVTGEEDGNPR